MFEKGFGAQYAIIFIRNPQDSIGNYLGPYVAYYMGGSLNQGRLQGPVYKGALLFRELSLRCFKVLGFKGLAEGIRFRA